MVGRAYREYTFPDGHKIDTTFAPKTPLQKWFAKSSTGDEGGPLTLFGLKKPGECAEGQNYACAWEMSNTALMFMVPGAAMGRAATVAEGAAAAPGVTAAKGADEIISGTNARGLVN